MRRWLARAANCEPDKIEYMFCGYVNDCDFKVLKAMNTDVFRAYVLCKNTEGCSRKTWVRVIVNNTGAYR